MINIILVWHFSIEQWRLHSCSVPNTQAWRRECLWRDTLAPVRAFVGLGPTIRLCLYKSASSLIFLLIAVYGRWLNRLITSSVYCELWCRLCWLHVMLTAMLASCYVAGYVGFMLSALLISGPYENWQGLWIMKFNPSNSRLIYYSYICMACCFLTCLSPLPLYSETMQVLI